MADDRLIVPDFDNIGEFKKWVGNLDERAIQKWTAADWVTFYKKIEPIQQEWYSSPHKMMTTCTEEFIKLHSNYRLEPKQLEYIRELARQAGKELAEQNVDAAELAIKTTNTDLINPANRNNAVRKMTEKVDNIAAESTKYAPEHRLQTMSIIDETMGNTQGVANMKGEKGFASIRVNTASAVDNTINVSAHEAAHVHFQTGNPLQMELLQKKILAHPELGEDFAALMMYNNKFYLDSRTIDDWFTYKSIAPLDEWGKKFRGYSHQPVEKFSQIYGLEVERAYRHAGNQISERTALKVCGYIGRTPEAVHYTSSGIEITYRAGLNEELSGKKLLKELEKKLGSSISEKLDIQMLDKAGKDVKITVPQESKFTNRFEKFLASRPETDAVADFINKSPSYAQYSDSEIKLMFPKSEITDKESYLLHKMEKLTGSKIIIDEADNKKVFTTVIVPRDKEFLTKVEQASNTSMFKKVIRKIDRAIDNTIEDCSEALNNSKVGKVYDKAKKAVAKSAPVQKAKEAAKTAKGAIVKGAKKVGQTQSAQTIKKAAQKTGKAVAESAAGKAVTKVAAKTVGSTAAKAVGKSVLKKIPLISIGAGLVFGAQRAMAGDFSGAALEVASGAAGTFPGLGTAASVAIDAGLAGRDIYNETQKAEDATKQQVKTDAKNAKTYGEQKVVQARQASDKAKSANRKPATAEKMKANAQNANKSRKQAEKTVVNANKSKAGKATETNSATKQKQYTQVIKAKSKGRE